MPGATTPLLLCQLVQLRRQIEQWTDAPTAILDTREMFR
jgi:hypothetical protein